MKKVEPRFRKVTLNIPIAIYNDLQERCKNMGTNTTTEIVALIRDGIKQEKVVDYMPTLLEAYFKETKKANKTKKVTR